MVFKCAVVVPMASCGALSLAAACYLPSLATRCARRETLRLAVFL